MKVTVCQIDPRDGRLEQDLAALAAHVARAESEFLLLPELCFGPWLAAEPPKAGTSAGAAAWNAYVAAHDAKIARLADLGAPSILSTRPTIEASGSRRNRAYLFDRAANVAAPLRDKTYLPDEPGYYEAQWYDRGPKDFEMARAGDARLGVMICTELWFLEWARHYAKSRVDLLCAPRATPHGSIDAWLAGGRVAGRCAGAFCLSSNLFSPDGEPGACGGLGWITDPEGEVLATTSEQNPFITMDLDLDIAKAAKKTYPRDVAE